MAKILYTHVNPSSKKDLKEACRVLANDGVIAYPTDVNWAFGCSLSSKKAQEKIRSLKPSHPADLPFSLLCDSVSMISTYADVDNLAFKVLKRVFPGPFTILLRRGKDFPRSLRDQRQQVGVRIPTTPLITDLIKEWGEPLATSSVPSIVPKRKKNEGTELLSYGYEIEEYYGHALELILDLGAPVPSLETTILDLSDGQIQVVREGFGDHRKIVS